MRTKAHRIVALLLGMSMILSSCAQTAAMATIEDDRTPTSDSPFAEGAPEESFSDVLPAENTEPQNTEPAVDPVPEQSPVEPAEVPAEEPAETPAEEPAETPAVEPEVTDPAPAPEETAAPEPTPEETPAPEPAPESIPVETPAAPAQPTPTPEPVAEAIRNEDIATPITVAQDKTPPTIKLTPVGGDQYYEEPSRVYCKGVKIEVSDDVQLARVMIVGDYADVGDNKIVPTVDKNSPDLKDGDIIGCDKTGLKTYVQKIETVHGNLWTYEIISTAKTLDNTNLNEEVYGRHDDYGAKTIIATDVEGNETTVSLNIGHYLGRRTDYYYDPTCTEDGHYKQIYTCAVCGDEWAVFKLDASAPALGHTWKQTAGMEGPDDDEGTPHSHTEGWTYVGTSCQGGASLYTRTCEVCGFTETEDEDGNPVTADGHRLGSEERTDPTCTQDGSIVRHCTNPDCNYTETVTLPSPGHMWNNWTVTKAASCTETGEGTYTCDICKQTRTETVETLPHSYQWVTTQEATCFAVGSEHQVCSVCGHVGETQELPLKAHDLQEVVTRPATCTADGEKVFKCMNEGCEHISHTVTLPATGHTWGEWTTTEKPTCQHAGTDTRTCTAADCGATETRTQLQVGHNYIDDHDCTTPNLCEYCGQRDPKAPLYNSHNYYNAPYHHDDSEHWRVCINPGCLHEEAHTAHTIAGKADGDCTTDVFCTVCRTTLQKGAATHNMSELISDGDKGHYQKCLNEDCNRHTAIQAHVVSDDGNCLTADTCQICNTEIRPAETGHEFGGPWYADETGHWQKCQHPGCAVTSDAVPHVGEDDDVLSTSVVCEVCGYTIVAGMTGVDNLTSPVITAVESTADGIRLQWNKVTGADQYRVLYRVGSEEWTTAGDTAETSYTWTGAANGVTYVFSVRCISKDGKYYTSYFDTTGKTAVFNTQPAAPDATAVDEGVLLQWPAVDGAARYRVLYKTNGNWQTLADVPAPEYLWTGAKDSTGYAFTVACLNADGTALTSGYDAEGTAFTYLARPEIATLQAQANGVKVAWNKTGASGYTLLTRQNDGEWEKAATTTATTYALTGIESGSTYDVSVEAYDNAGNTSGYDEVGASIEFVAAPELPEAACVAEGIRLDWEPVKGAANYRVFYKTGKNAWQTLADTNTNSYLWTGAKHNTTYTFTVACLNADGSEVTSTYDTAGTALTWLDEASVTAIALANTGIKVTWAKLAGAKQYRLYYKLNEGEWTQILDTTATSYTWNGAQAGGTYTFAVQALDAKGNGGSFGNAGKVKSFTCSEQPQPPVVTGAPAGIQISWTPVSGAANYRLLYKIGTGAWKTLTDTPFTEYSWTKAASGTTYAFTVACLSNDGKTLTSSYNEAGTSFVYLAEPNLTAVTNLANGIKLTWSKVAGATSYRILYRTGSEDWTALTDTTATTYTWTGAVGGVAYQFDVQALNKAGNTSTLGNEYKAITFNAQPKLKSVTNTETGILLEWDAVPGASAYRILYKNGKNWDTVADTSATSYLWTAGKAGTAYTFTLCGLGDDGTISSYDTKGITLTSLAKPATPTVTGLTNGIKISWAKVAGANKYRLYYRTDGTDWTKLTDSSSTTYSWTKAQSGVPYYFTVQAFKGNDASDYDQTGTPYQFIAQPGLPTVANVAGGVEITWPALNGAAKYRVLVKNGANWDQIAETAETRFLWTEGKANTAYTFTIQAVGADGSTSAYNTKGTAFSTVGAPELPTMSALANGIKISWAKVTGANKYRLYYRTADSGWTKLVESASTTYSWTKAQSGVTYYFTVQALKGAYASDYDQTGAAWEYISQPAVPTVASAANGLQLSWTAVNGAVSYTVYSKTGKETWKEIGTASGNSFVWGEAPVGTAYSFTVQAVGAGGGQSTYNNTGSKAAMYLPQPALPAVTNTAKGIQIDWTMVDGAKTYRIWYRTGTGAWKKLADSKTLTYTWTKPKANTAYAFAIQAVNGSYVSSYDPDGVNITFTK